LNQNNQPFGKRLNQNNQPKCNQIIIIFNIEVRDQLSFISVRFWLNLFSKGWFGFGSTFFQKVGCFGSTFFQKVGCFWLNLL